MTGCPADVAGRIAAGHNYRMRRYFGYGSNLNADDLTRWCESTDEPIGFLRPIGPAWLADYAPRFSHHSVARGGGALNIEPYIGAVTPGVLFDVDEDRGGLRALDRKEGRGTRYDAVDVHVHTPDGRMHPAVTYVVERPRRPFFDPAGGYVDVVRDGMNRHGIDAAALDAAERNDVPVMCHDLFVYGTLLPGERRHPQLPSHDDLGPATARGRLFDTGRGYPAMVEGTGTVRGRRVRLHDPQSALPVLDAIEGFEGYDERSHSLYHRRLVPVESLDAAGPAWTYLYANDTHHYVAIDHGDWLTRA